MVQLKTSEVTIIFINVEKVKWNFFWQLYIIISTGVRTMQGGTKTVGKSNAIFMYNNIAAG